MEIDFGFFRVFDPYFIGKSLGNCKKNYIWILVIYLTPLIWRGGTRTLGRLLLAYLLTTKQYSEQKIVLA